MNAKTTSPASEVAQPEHPPKPQDGSLLMEVVEEQEYISQQENHVIPGSSHPASQPADEKRHGKR